GQGARPRMRVLAQVVLGRGRMQTALRIKHILTPSFIKANRYLMASAAQSALAMATEAPGAEKTRAALRRQPVIMDARGQRRLGPSAGIEMDLMPVRQQAPGQ